MRSLRTCKNGHKYYNSSDCPVCPICESMKKPDAEILSVVAAPARRALESAGIRTVSQLSDYSKNQLLKLHGMGPSSIPKLRNVLKIHGLDFKKWARSCTPSFQSFWSSWCPTLACIFWLDSWSGNYREMLKVNSENFFSKKLGHAVVK